MKKILKYKEYIILCATISVVCLFMYGKVLFFNYEFLPPDSYSAKAVEQGFHLSEEKYDQYPLWLPWMFSGLPSVHSFQNISEYYYPYKIFKILREFGILRFYEFIFHFIFAGLGMFILLKRIGCNSYSSIFGGLSYVTMPYLVANLIHGHGSLVMTASYIPWILWALINLFDKKNILSLGILGILIGFQLQRAHVQIAYYTWMMIGLYVIFYIIKLIYQKNDIFFWKSNPLLLLLGSLILGLGLSASIYFPVISYISHSTRSSAEGGIGIAQSMGWSFPPIESIVFLLPSFFGFGGHTYWGLIEFTDYPQYMGLIVIIFAIYGCFSSKKIKYFLIATLLFAFLISLGRYFEVFYSIFYYSFPFFDKFRVPMYILILMQFSICILSGIGFNHFINNIKNKNNEKNIYRVIGIIFAFVSIIFLFKNSLINFKIKNMQYYGSNVHEILDPIRLELINQSFYNFIILIILFLLFIKFKNFFVNTISLSVAIISLSLIDISIINYKILNPNQKKYRTSPLVKGEYLDAYLKKDMVIDFLLKDTTKYRIWSIHELERSNRWSAFNIESVSGYHPAKLNNYSDIINSTGFIMPGIMKTLNIKYIISLHEMLNEQKPEYLELVFSGPIYVENKKKYSTGYIYQYKNYYDRLFFSKSIKVLDKKKQIIELNNNYFNPKDISMLSKPIKEEIKYDSKGEIELIHWSPNKMIIKTNSKSKQFLNISEIFYPHGWIAKNLTKNNIIEIYEVNSLIRGIITDIGENLYLIEYQPIENRIGSVTSFCSFMILCFLIILGVKNEKK